jgi:hypothetical protein
MNIRSRMQRQPGRTGFQPEPARLGKPCYVTLLLTCFFSFFVGVQGAPLPEGEPVRAWMLLSGSEPDDLAVITAAPQYKINTLLLSHAQLLNSLNDLRDRNRRDLINRLIDAAHEHGISDVLLWEHSLYSLRYYPPEFRTGPGGTIDLDNPAFWEWFKADYRKNLQRVPHANGLVLTFVETGARIEQQYSQKLKTNQEKLAKLVDTIAEVVIDEKHLKLYARTFGHRAKDYENIIGAVKLFKNSKTRLIMKEVPHDFFLTHPNDFYAGTVDRTTVMEFDACGEYNGIGTIANTWPQYVLKRWSDFAHRPHVIGYFARTDRFDNSRQVGKPGEINLLALARGFENPNISPEAVYDEFITAHYGAAALPEVKAAFKNAENIVKCTLYILGTYVANHSNLEYEPYSAYIGMCSGRWLDPPISHVEHGVNRDFHYWSDVIDHLAPPFVKADQETWDADAEGILEKGWIHPGEQMNEEYLRYIVTEKNWGVKLCEDSLSHIEKAKPDLSAENYRQLHEYFERSLLTAKLHRGASSAYFGFRAWCRGKEFQTDFVRTTVQSGLDEIDQVGKLIHDYSGEVPKGAWDWRRDAVTAGRYRQQILEGWPAETKGFKNPNAGMKFQ